MPPPVSSKRGNPKLVHENHIYVYAKPAKDGVHGIWVCEKRDECKGRVWTIGTDGTGEVTKIVTQHNHAAQAARPEALRMVQEMKERAATSEERPHQIMGAVIAGAHANVLAHLPRKDSIKRTMRRAKGEDDHPELPPTVELLIIPPSYTQISIDGDNQQFLQYDSDQEILPGRMLIFSTPTNLTLLSQAQDWFADGTFSTAPALFGQFYTIHVIKFGMVLPVVYALLPDKRQVTYEKLLQELRNLQPGLQPQRLMTDFEQAALNAFGIQFPGITKSGCFFHLSQCVWRKVQAEGLKERYENDHDFARWIRMIPALAFVPPPDVIASFDTLSEDENFPGEALPIASYSAGP